MSAANSSELYRAPRVEITEALAPDFAAILTPDAVEFVADLERQYGMRRLELLARRRLRQTEFNQGKLPDFLPETAWIRRLEWTVKKAPQDLQDRRVEITGPVNRKMMINALNSGAKTFMADLEDSHSPTWKATIEGQINLRDSVDRTLSYTSPEGKLYALNDELATLIVRPRGWHLSEKHLLVDGQRMSAALFDFGLYFFHNAAKALAQGSGPYFYLPKLESHLEARLWNDVIYYAESRLGIPRGSTCCTVLIETLPAAFEMDEILYELKDYIVGLNCGRWDYIFSFIKCFHADPERVLPDRSQVTMSAPFLRAYTRLLIKTCHRRRAHAIGGMAAQIPIKDDPAADAEAKAKVRADKEREASDGHDGTWVAHPALVPVALEVFDRHMPQPNQLQRPLDDIPVTTKDLLVTPEGTITEAGLKNNVSAALHYLAAWLSGRGAVPFHHLMEDAATVEIARSQLWQWAHYPQGRLDDGRKVTFEMVISALQEELVIQRTELGPETCKDCHYEEAAGLLRKVIGDVEFVEFLTLPAYEMLH